MKLAMIGLGKMGANMARRLVRDGHQVVAYDVDIENATALAAEHHNITAVDSLQQLVNSLDCATCGLADGAASVCRSEYRIAARRWSQQRRSAGRWR